MMIEDSEDFLPRLAAAAAAATGRDRRDFELQLLPREAGKEEVADATLVAILRAPTGDGLFLSVSNASFPDFVAEASARTREIAAELTPGAARRVVLPLHEGRLDGRSYAAHPLMHPLSAGRVPRYVEKRLLARHVVPWLIEVARATRAPIAQHEIEARYAVPLRRLAETEDLASGTRAMARAAQARLDRVAPDLFSVLEHGDFWMGNVLLEAGRPRLLAALGGRFGVTDWPSARLDGHPGIDILRFCMSLRRLDAPASGGEIARYLEAVEMRAETLAVDAMASLGDLGERLGEFPRRRYLELVDRVAGLIAAQGYGG